MAENDYKLRHRRNSEGIVEVAEHFHDFYEIFFLLSGETVEYNIEGRSYRLRPNDILLINSQDVHRAVSLGRDYDRLLLWIHPPYLKKISTLTTNLCACFDNIGIMRNKNLLRLNPSSHTKIRNAFLKIEEIYACDSYGNDVLMRSYLTEFLVSINRYCLDPYNAIVASDMSSSKLVEAALQHIDANISGDLSLDALSRHLFVSKYHLLREFKKCIGYTVHQYILIKRLLMAEGLLVEGGLSITEICFRCGFADYANFIRTFTKHYGVPPGKFSKKPRIFKDEGDLK